MKSFEQVWSGRWPSGGDKPVALLAAEPDELVQRYGLRFTEGVDDLDEFREAALRLRSGRPVLLVRYRHQPGPGTTVSIDQADHPAQAIRELRDAFRLDEREFVWTADSPASSPGAQSPAADQPERPHAGFVLQVLRWLAIPVSMAVAGLDRIFSVLHR
jgi:hypothetical protein